LSRRRATNAARLPDALKNADTRPNPSVAEAGSDRKRSLHPAPAAAPAVSQRPADGSPPRLAASLLRTRPVATGEHFNVHCKLLPAGSGVLLMAVPKRLLARAVDRNLVRRLAREAWRAAALHRLPMAAMVKLTRRPACLASLRAARAKVSAASRAAMQQSTGAASKGAVSTVAVVGSRPLPAVTGGRSRCKKLLRAELDQLFAAAQRRLGGGHRP